MTRLAERKTRLSLITNQTARYRGQDRAVVAAEVFADRERRRKKAERGAKHDHLRAGCEP